MTRNRLRALLVSALLLGLFTIAPRGAEAAPTQGDIIFVVDESGSMFDVQQSLGDEIGQVAADLAAVIDAQFGLVGYGASSPTPTVELPVTDDIAALEAAIDGLTVDGFTEPGYDATLTALSPAMDRRAAAGTCVVIVTDEPSNGDSASQQDAIDALVADGAYFFGIVDDRFGPTSASFQPLSDATGGELFVGFSDFLADPQTVLDELLETCAAQILTGRTTVDVKPTSCPNPFQMKATGVLPAAILGSDTLDVTEIDPTSVVLTGPEGDVPALRTAIEDVATPDDFPHPETRHDCGTDGADGFDDLTAKFDHQAVAAVLGPVAKGDTVLLTISAETFGGATLSGVDIIWIR